MFKNIILLFALVIMAGCSATGPKFSQLEALESHSALVYVYRPWAILDGAAAPTIQLNNVDVFDLSNGGYEILKVKPGNNKITVKKGAFISNWRADEMNIEYSFAANKRYFLRLTAELDNLGAYGSIISVSGIYRFGLVTEEVALIQLKDVKKN